ncbi:hypothetical protein MKK75_18190 [Methylobacterium sp. J-030]|uniref:hypothetical protein n=1 Tax=Methylobacterium sp. J-030 TaxID=2836627 RepID=UPI001FBABF36|nr:hypothetical protein [Methylobacterium sp. J-030]MCJ2070698.1 hypothetical protein [Methylobacterium sp. J-030]
MAQRFASLYRATIPRPKPDRHDTLNGRNPDLHVQRASLGLSRRWQAEMRQGQGCSFATTVPQVLRNEAVAYRKAGDVACDSILHTIEAGGHHRRTAGNGMRPATVRHQFDQRRS